jgi:uncharacterized YceG family protein
VLARRLVAVAVVIVVLAVGIWAAAAAIGGGGKTKTQAQPTTTGVVVPKPFHVVFPEGFTREQMAERVGSVAKIAEDERGRPVLLGPRPYLAASLPRVVPGFGRKPLEGFLFPATYEFTAATTSRQLVQNQLRAFEKNWATLDLSYAKTKKLTSYDVLIIASMVERETLAPDERPLVAAVIYNRLHAHMALGIDATLRYGLHIPPTESIRQSQLESDNPYNTRKLLGLTPTPIGNPGLASLQAAAHPAKVKYLYFVRKPDKVHHFFTASYTAFVNYENAHGYGK